MLSQIHPIDLMSWTLVLPALYGVADPIAISRR